jgi:hypothetical protein
MRFFPSSGRPAKACEHLNDPYQKIATSLIAGVAEDSAVVEEFQRSGAFHRASASHAVETAFVICTVTPRAFRDVEDDAFGCPQELIAQVGCATHML